MSSAGVVEYFDQPVLTRRVYAVLAAIFGLTWVFAGTWNLRCCNVLSSFEIGALAFGICCILAGGVMWVIPARQPRLGLRADASGLVFTTSAPIAAAATYQTIAWDLIADVRVIDHLDAAALEIEVFDVELEALFSAPRGTKTKKFVVPIMRYRPWRFGERLVHAIKLLQRTRFASQTDMSNSSVQPTPLGAADAGR
jgi:hypothetical protein